MFFRLAAQSIWNRTYVILYLGCLLSILTGCATAEYNRLPTPSSTGVSVPAPTSPKSNITSTPPVAVSTTSATAKGIYHKVEKGQTIFRIAKAYNVPLEAIIRANKIPDAAAIEVNQLVFIPQATTQIKIENELLSYEPAPIQVEDKNKDEFVWPVKGKIRGYFNDLKKDAVNKGIDIEASPGEWVNAAREGKVILNDYIASWGHTVMIDHGDGFISVYAQMTESKLKIGDMVRKGEAIAQVATMGQRSFLHFQIRKGQMAVNPLYYLP